MIFQKWFPTIISITENLLNEEDNLKLINLSKQVSNIAEKGGQHWISQSNFNTQSTYNLLNDKNFNFFIDKVSTKIQEHAKNLKSNYLYKCQEAWLNTYKTKDYQEYHCHAGSVFSAVFYLANPKKGGKIYFENPIEPDMVPLKNITEYDFDNSSTCNFQPNPNTLIIFRSNIRHMVTPVETDETRATIALNFGY